MMSDDYYLLLIGVEYGHVALMELIVPLTEPAAPMERITLTGRIALA
jgi:hypothetical protein